VCLFIHICLSIFTYIYVNRRRSFFGQGGGGGGGLTCSWLIHTCAMTHPYVYHDLSISLQWLIHICAMTRSYMCHDSFVYHVSLVCVPWLIHICAMTQGQQPRPTATPSIYTLDSRLHHMCAMIHPYVYLYSSIRVYVCHDSGAAAKTNCHNLYACIGSMFSGREDSSKLAIANRQVCWRECINLFGKASLSSLFCVTFGFFVFTWACFDFFWRFFQIYPLPIARSVCGNASLYCISFSHVSFALLFYRTVFSKTGLFHVSVRVCMCVWLYVSVHLCMYVCICMYVRKCVCVCVSVCMHARECVCLCVYMSVCMDVQKCVCLCVCMYMYGCIYKCLST